MRQTQATTHTAKKNYKNNSHPQHYVKQKYTNRTLAKSHKKRVSTH